MKRLSDDIPRLIVTRLALVGPLTFPEIACEVYCLTEPSDVADVLPAVIKALAELINDGVICNYIKSPLTKPMNHAWALSEEKVQAIGLAAYENGEDHL